MSRPEHTLARGAWIGTFACVLALALAGCRFCDTTQARLVLGFESNCIDSACGFQGTDLQVVTSWHPGEHALRIPANGTATSLINDTVAGFAGASLTLIGRCDGGATLTIDLAGTWVTQAPGVTWVAMSGPTIPDPLPNTSGCRPSRVLPEISVAVSGEGACEIDNVTVVTTTTICTGEGFGCTDPPRDGGFDAAHDVPSTRDAGPAAYLFSRCTLDADCAALGGNAACLTGYPFAFCTAACTSSAGCGVGSACVSGLCLPSCSLWDGYDVCGLYGAACSAIDAGSGIAACVPSCYAQGSPRDEPVCPSRAVCDPYTGRCGEEHRGSAPNGAPCGSRLDCSGGQCATAVDPTTGAPTAFVGGMCYSLGRLSDPRRYVSGAPLPQENCPAGSAPFPTAGLSQGDQVACFATCAIDADCRAGYACAMGVGRVTPSTGWCLPQNCAAYGTTVSLCQAGYACEVVGLDDAGVTQARCTLLTSADAGTEGGSAADGGLDASADGS